MSPVVLLYHILKVNIFYRLHDEQNTSLESVRF